MDKDNLILVSHQVSIFEKILHYLFICNLNEKKNVYLYNNIRRRSKIRKNKTIAHGYHSLISKDCYSEE